MKEKLIEVGTLLCVAVLTCLLLVHALAIFPGVPAIRWFLVTSAVVLGRLDAPAWVQAVGSVVAILVAVAIPWQQRREEAKTARRTAVAVAMVIGAEISSKVDMALACGQAMLFEHKEPRFADPRKRAQFFLEIFNRYQLPLDDQMLHLAQAMPVAAARIAYGFASLRRVRVALELVISGGATGTASPAVLDAAYAGTRLNLLMAMRALRVARRLLRDFKGN